jgi:hypothetical protein
MMGMDIQVRPYVHVRIHYLKVTSRHECLQGNRLARDQKLHPLKLVKHHLKEVGAATINVRANDTSGYE